MNARISRYAGLGAGLMLLLTAPAVAEAPAGRYTIAGGTVLDNMTKLTWQRIPPSTTYTWDGAKAICANLGTTLGGSGWRLPTVKELMSLADYSYVVSGAALDPNAFPSPQPTIYWSASRSTANPPAWTVSCSYGSASRRAAKSGEVNSVRCVR